MTSRKLVADAIEGMAVKFAGGGSPAGRIVSDAVTTELRKLRSDVLAGRYDPLGGGATPDAIRVMVFARQQLGCDIVIDDDMIGGASANFRATDDHGFVRVEVAASDREQVRWVLRGALEAVQLYRERV